MNQPPPQPANPVSPNNSSSSEDLASSNHVAASVQEVPPTSASSSTTAQRAAILPDPSKSYHSLSFAFETYLTHDSEEKNHWEDVCRSYRQYAIFAMAQWTNHQYRFHAIREEHRRLLPRGLQRETPEFQERATLYKEAAIRNQFALDCILRHAGQAHSQEVSHHSPSHSGSLHPQYSSDAQMSKVSSVLKSLARDWSGEYREERDMTYRPLLELVQKYVPLPLGALPPRICVPGAGVGRLAFELAALGYSVQGNEFSLYMLLASDFILNAGISPQTPLKISPWLLESRNVHHPNDPTRIVFIPDVDPYMLLQTKIRQDCALAQDRPAVEPSERAGDSVERDSVPPPAEFSMAAGEFVSVYGAPREQGQWDAVVACFFLDASPSIVEYLQVVHSMLKVGGLLVNLGPLLWHWSGPAMRPDDSFEEYIQRYSYLDAKYLTSVDLCWEDIQAVLCNIGFSLEECETGHPAYYTADRKSMMNTEYRCISFVARKVTPASNSG